MLGPENYQCTCNWPSSIHVPVRPNSILLLQLFQKYGKAAELYDTVARATRYEVLLREGPKLLFDMARTSLLMSRCAEYLERLSICSVLMFLVVLYFPFPESLLENSTSFCINRGLVDAFCRF